MRIVEIHPEALNELEEARAWYESKSEGLGMQFLDEVGRIIDSIQKYPGTWSPYTEGRVVSSCIASHTLSYIVMISRKFRFLQSCTCIGNRDTGKNVCHKTCRLSANEYSEQKIRKFLDEDPNKTHVRGSKCL